SRRDRKAQRAVKLRDYQERAVRDLRAVYASGKRAPCLVMPTGGGKTPTAAEIVRLALAKGNRVLFAAGRIELLNQAVNKLSLAGISEVRVIQAENDNQIVSPITVASIPTLASRRWIGQLPPADLVVLDEVHHVRAAKTWAPIAGHYSQAKLLGLTATPARGDGLGLGEILDSIVVGATIQELTPKYLVPCRVLAPPRIL